MVPNRANMQNMIALNIVIVSTIIIIMMVGV